MAAWKQQTDDPIFNQFSGHFSLSFRLNVSTALHISAYTPLIHSGYS